MSRFLGGNIKRFLFILVILICGIIATLIILRESPVSNVDTGSILGATTSGDVNHPQESYVGNSQYKTLAAMLNALDVTTYPQDKVVVFPDPSMGLGSIIRITRATTVTVRDGKDSTVYRTWQDNVKGLFDEKQIEIGDKDVVSPAVDTAISMNLAISITRVQESDTKEVLTIPFKTTTKDDPNLEKGKQRVEVEGREGSKERLYHLRRENGKLVSKDLVSEKIVQEAVDKVIVKGTKPPLNLLSRGTYKDVINAAAQKYGISASALYCLMMAESNGHYNSVARAGYKGLFQYSDSAWKSLSPSAGYSGASIFDPTAQIYTTAWALTHGQGGRWGPWGGCKNK